MESSSAWWAFGPREHQTNTFVLATYRAIFDSHSTYALCEITLIYYFRICDVHNDPIQVAFWSDLSERRWNTLVLCTIQQQLKNMFAIGAGFEINSDHNAHSTCSSLTTSQISERSILHRILSYIASNEHENFTEYSPIFQSMKIYGRSKTTLN